MKYVIISCSLLVFLLVFYMGAIVCLQKCRTYIKRRNIELLHYTIKTNADSIVSTNSILAGEDGHCYFFIKTKRAISTKKIKYNKLSNTDTVIVIKGLSANQRSNYRFDTRFNVFRHKGDLEFCLDNTIRVYDRATFENAAYDQPRRK